MREHGWTEYTLPNWTYGKLLPAKPTGQGAAPRESTSMSTKVREATGFQNWVYYGEAIHDTLQ